MFPSSIIVGVQLLDRALLQKLPADRAPGSMRFLNDVKQWTGGPYILQAPLIPSWYEARNVTNSHVKMTPLFYVLLKKKEVEF